jgi:hypothetical protein
MLFRLAPMLVLLALVLDEQADCLRVFGQEARGLCDRP